MRQRDGFGSGFPDRLERFADPIFRQGPVDPLLVVRRVVAVDACRRNRFLNRPYKSILLISSVACTIKVLRL